MRAYFHPPFDFYFTDMFAFIFIEYILDLTTKQWENLTIANANGYRIHS